MSNERDGVEERFKCIPVRVKVEVGDFYYNLVEPLKESKELSTFIVNMLRAYYEDEDVANALNAYNERNNPLALMQAQLNNVMLNHQKSMAMLHNTKMTVDSASDEIINQGGIGVDKKDEDERIRRIVSEELAKALSNIGVNVENKVITTESSKNDDSVVSENIDEKSEILSIGNAEQSNITGGKEVISYNEKNVVNKDDSKIEITEDKEESGGSPALSKLRKLKASTSHS